MHPAIWEAVSAYRSGDMTGAAKVLRAADLALCEVALNLGWLVVQDGKARPLAADFAEDIDTAVVVIDLLNELEVGDPAAAHRLMHTVSHHQATVVASTLLSLAAQMVDQVEGLRRN